LADGRKNNGGHPKSGRKSKAEEVKMIEKLTPLAPLAYKALETGLKNQDFKFVQLFFHYFAGKPKEKIDITSQGDKVVSIEPVQWVQGMNDLEENNG